MPATFANIALSVDLMQVQAALPPAGHALETLGEGVAALTRALPAPIVEMGASVGQVVHPWVDSAASAAGACLSACGLAM
ncbi:MAG: hypothetical protein ACK5KO_06055 [Arachnia sp.]